MTHPYWPLFDVEVRTPRVTLRYIDDDLAVDLAALAADGIHDPATMPFLDPWTDRPSPELERSALQFWWRTRAEVRPEHWNLTFAVFVDGEVVGATGLGADDFVTLRSFETGSWLGRAHQGRGIGKEMRQATLHLGFAGFDAEFATTGAFADNGSSLGVTRSLGYQPEGSRRVVRRGAAAEVLGFRMSRSHWETIRRDDIIVAGLDAARAFLGIV